MKASILKRRIWVKLRRAVQWCLGGLVAGWLCGVIPSPASAQTRVDITAVTVQSDSQHINAVATYTIQVTTATVIPNAKRIRITFPAGTVVTGALLDAASVFQSGGAALQSAVGTEVRLRITGAGLNPGPQTIILTGIVNTGTPASGLALDITSFEPPNIIIDDDDLTPATFAISGTVTLAQASVPIAINNLERQAATAGVIALTNFRLTAQGEDADITQLKFTPSYAVLTPAMLTGLDVYRDVNSNGVLDAGETSISSGSAALAGSGTELTVAIPNHRLSNGMAQEFFIAGSFTTSLASGSTISVRISAMSALAARPIGITSGIQTGPGGPPGFTVNGITHEATSILDESDPDAFVPPDTVTISGAAGGTITLPAGGIFTKSSLIIPPGAFEGTLSITISAPPTVPFHGVYSAIQLAVEGASDFAFNTAVRLILEYLAQEFTGDASTLAIHQWDESGGNWLAIEDSNTVDLEERTIGTRIQRLGIFGIISIPDTTISTTLQAGWNMIAAPVEPRPVTHPALTFVNVHPFRMQQGNSSIYTYDESSNDWVIPDSLQNAAGYIIWSFDPETIVTFTGRRVRSDVIRAVRRDGIGTYRGWHLLGNPWVVPLDLATGLTLTNVSPVVARWNGAEYEFYPDGGLDRELPVGAAFFALSTGANASVTFHYPGLSKAAAGPPAIFAYDWRLQIAARAGRITDTHNYIGVSNSAADGQDVMDVVEFSPLNTGYISLRFQHPEWDEGPGWYTQDMRSPQARTWTWNGEVVTSIMDSAVTLSWELPADFPGYLRAVLIDKQNGLQTDMRSATGYSFAKEGDAGSPKQAGTLTRQFTILVEAEEIQASIPDSYQLLQNYPNPFNPSKTIAYQLPDESEVQLAIHDMLGRKVRTLINQRQHAGQYHILWDGRNEDALQAASGLYIYRLTTSAFTATKKMLLLR